MFAPLASLLLAAASTMDASALEAQIEALLLHSNSSTTCPARIRSRVRAFGLLMHSMDLHTLLEDILMHVYACISVYIYTYTYT